MRRFISLRIHEASEKCFMKTAEKHVSIYRLRAALKWLLDEYASLDSARRLCADHCITADDIVHMIDKVPKPKRLKPRMTFTIFNPARS
jgi:hypothetical protein